jgi:hypothetical protein
MKAGFFYYIRAGFGLCSIFIEFLWGIVTGLVMGVFAGVSFLIALVISTLRVIGQAIYELALEDWRDRRGSVPKMENPPPPPPKGANSFEISRLRKQQELVQRYKKKE